MKKLKLLLLVSLISLSNLNAGNHEPIKIDIDFVGWPEVKAANSLWFNFASNPRKPSIQPRKITYADIRKKPLLDKITVDLNQASLQKGINRLLQKKSKDCATCLGNGGVISFKSKGVLKVNSLITLPRQYQSKDRFYDRTILIEAYGVTFDAQNKTSIFFIDNNVRLIIQNATFQNARFSKNLVSAKEFSRRKGAGGGAIVTKGKASIRAHGCTFLNNKVTFSKGMDTGGNISTENYNGGAIRLENYSNAEIFDCYFKGNEGITGGAIGGSSINKLTIVNSLFENNISTGYKDNRPFGVRKFYVQEGAAAVRIDRTVETIEVHGSSFIGNKANNKVSTFVVFGMAAAGKSKPSLTLNIDNCFFSKNGDYKFKGEPFNKGQDRTGVLSTLLFHAGEENVRMKMTNTVFDNNEVGQANVRILGAFDFSKVTFSNTKFHKAPFMNAAVWLQLVTSASSFDNCVFLNNRSNGKSTNTRVGSEIAGWNHTSANRVVLKNSSFYGVGGNSPLVGIAETKFTKFRSNNSINNVFFVKNFNNSKRNLEPVSSKGFINTNPNLKWTNFSRYYNTAKKQIKAVTYVRGNLDRAVSAKRTTEVREVKLYPNPATNNIINLRGSNLRGEIVIKSTLVKEPLLRYNNKQLNNATIDISSLPSGKTYVVFVNGRWFERFVKK